MPQPSPTTPAQIPILRRLPYFLAAAEELHFGRAAARLRIAQPSLSQQVKLLEKELGVVLFRRSRRGVALTKAGEVLLDRGSALLAQAMRIETLVQRAGQGRAGRLSIGYIPAAAYDLLPRLLAAFRLRFPEVGIDIREAVTQEQIDALLAHRLDVGILRPHLEYPGVTMRRVATEVLVVALPAAHPLAARESLSIADLADEDFAFLSHRRAPDYFDRLIALCLELGFSPSITHEVEDMHSLASLVAAGICVAVLPASASTFQVRNVEYRRIDGPNVTVDIALAWLTNTEAPVVRAFCEVAREIELDNDVSLALPPAR